MPRPRNAVPKLYRHPTNSNAYVKWAGRTLSLGKWGPDADARYREIVEHFVDTGEVRIEPRRPTHGIAVEELERLYLRHARDHVTKNGQATSALARTERALDLLYRSGVGAGLPAERFGPRSLDDFRVWLAQDPKGRWSRTTINQYADVIVNMFRWGVARELVEPHVVAGLRELQGLRRGRPVGGRYLREPKKVRGVDPAIFEQTLEHCRDEIAAIARVQRLTAMRPGEVLGMRQADIEPLDESVALYRVRPDTNKLEHHGIDRTVFIGPRALAIIQPRLEGLAPGAYVFCPRRATGFGGDRYQNPAYNRAIRRACERAGVPRWTPNQLRHEGAALIASTASMAVARDALGHASSRTTDRYVDARSAELAALARSIG